jgi:hypothetical protein
LPSRMLVIHIVHVARKRLIADCTFTACHENTSVGRTTWAAFLKGGLPVYLSLAVRPLFTLLFASYLLCSHTCGALSHPAHTQKNDGPPEPLPSHTSREAVKLFVCRLAFTIFPLSTKEVPWVTFERGLCRCTYFGVVFHAHAREVVFLHLPGPAVHPQA